MVQLKHLPLVITNRIKEETTLTSTFEILLSVEKRISFPTTATSIYIEGVTVWRELLKDGKILPFIHFHFPCSVHPVKTFFIMETFLQNEGIIYRPELQERYMVVYKTFYRRFLDLPNATDAPPLSLLEEIAYQYNYYILQ